MITSPAGHLDVTVGESIVLPCQVSHDPTLDLKFTWFFNEQLIHFGSHWAYFEKVGGVSAIMSLDLLCLQVKVGRKYVNKLYINVPRHVIKFKLPFNSSLWQNYRMYLKHQILVVAK